jgi:hypothetical protein
MAWAKLDDRFHSNPKISRVWHTCPNAVGLYVMSITHCSQHETDGKVDDYFVIALVPDKDLREAIIFALVDADLWTIVEAGSFQIPDYLDFNPSHAELEKRRKTDKTRQAKGRKTQAQSKDSVRVLSERSPSGVRADTLRAVPIVSERREPNLSERPDPSRPDPSRSEGSYLPESSFLESSGGSYPVEATIEASRGITG